MDYDSQDSEPILFIEALFSILCILQSLWKLFLHFRVDSFSSIRWDLWHEGKIWSSLFFLFTVLPLLIHIIIQIHLLRFFQVEAELKQTPYLYLYCASFSFSFYQQFHRHTLHLIHFSSLLSSQNLLASILTKLRFNLLYLFSFSIHLLLFPTLLFFFWFVR